MAKPFGPKADMAADRKAGIKEGSKRDLALDKKRGVIDAPIQKAAHKAAKKR
jgi:hypothetical protein